VRRAHPQVRIDVAAPLDQHPAMVDALLDRARESACKPA
jgi:sirohydrochlorin ferrochelatase